MRFDIVTIFSEMFLSPLKQSLLKRALEQQIIEIFFHDIRKFAKDRHRSVDDAPYGGGAGMIMAAPPLVAAVEAISLKDKRLRVLLTPQGEPFTQVLAHKFSALDQLILICGRYEGVDERARELVVDCEISIGDYVLTGGELPALVIVDAVTRLLPGTLGCPASLEEESFQAGLLEYPHYTRPENFRGKSVPPVLLSGHHAEIAQWRRKKALERTLRRRPDLLEKCDLPQKDRDFLKTLERVTK